MEIPRIRDGYAFEPYDDESLEAIVEGGDYKIETAGKNKVISDANRSIYVPLSQIPLMENPGIETESTFVTEKQLRQIPDDVIYIGNATYAMGSLVKSYLKDTVKT